MAMLAEAKSKEKWSLDPRNTKWSSDKDRYGYQMMEKMGWSSGKGLGKHKSGSTSHVKIKKRTQNLGLGANESHDKDWLGQQTDFNNLLLALQKHGGNAELRNEVENSKAMLEVAKASRKRVFYKRFIRSKDTSHYSQKDMACIFGNLPSESAPTTPLEQSNDDVDSSNSAASCPTIPSDSTPGLVTYTSKQNIQEYFASRMKELHDKGMESNDQSKGEVNSDETFHGKKDSARHSGIGEDRNDGMKRNNAIDDQGKKGTYSDENGDEKKRKPPVVDLIETESKKSKKKSKRTRELEIETLADVKGGVDNEIVGNDEHILMKESKRKLKTSKKFKKNDGLQNVNEVEKIDRTNTESLTNAAVTKFTDEEILEATEAKTKKSKKCKKPDKLQHLKPCGKCLTNENEKEFRDEEISHEGRNVTEETRTKKRKQKNDPENTRLAKRKKSLRDTDVLSVREGKHRKIKKPKKPARSKTLNAKNEELSAAVSENCLAEVHSEDRSAISFAGKEDRVKRKNNKKKKRDIEVDIGDDGIATCNEEFISGKCKEYTIEEQTGLKNKKNKIKKKKRKARQDKKDS